MNYFSLKLLKIYLKRHSLLRILQIKECLNIYLKGISIEFGAVKNRDKTFSNFFDGKSKFRFYPVFSLFFSFRASPIATLIQKDCGDSNLLPSRW